MHGYCSTRALPHSNEHALSDTPRAWDSRICVVLLIFLGAAGVDGADQMCWIVDEWVKRSVEGGVSVSPPVQSRTYQIISEAQLAFNGEQFSLLFHLGTVSVE